MQPFTTLEAIAVPLDQPNVDTDQIVPARFLREPRQIQAEIYFYDLRYDDEGRPRPEFVLNQPSYNGARIMVADRNFGCGSSRECAVTVLLDNGFRTVIAPSFSDIFFNNCFQNGVLPIRLDADRVKQIREMLHFSPGARIAIDLANQTVLGPDGKTDHFAVDSFRKDCLLKGVDDINLTLSYEGDIAAFEARQRETMAWLG
ncbi:3-isopropylmalate dehydratase small subunit [Peristeroidobacter soli]|uniref:3-isopropylmalate dehydratase small subunit n=1 Tax=Peristeroidobacter soli TaxID=2497877 RepID=UPI00101CD952|nr:3-isopropylmalate dehydratase small subunit [Peristeroidobacter soli]